MIESVRVYRRCWIGFDGAGQRDDMTSLVQFRITWTMAAGFDREDAKMFDGMKLLDLPEGATPMLTGIYTLPYDGHPGACIAALAYLWRINDPVTGMPDVVARLAVRGDERHDPDREFNCPIGESGPHIYTLPIHDEEPIPKN